MEEDGGMPGTDLAVYGALLGALACPAGTVVVAVAERKTHQWLWVERQLPAPVSAPACASRRGPCCPRCCCAAAAPAAAAAATHAAAFAANCRLTGGTVSSSKCACTDCVANPPPPTHPPATRRRGCGHAGGAARGQKVLPHRRGDVWGGHRGAGAGGGCPAH